MHAGRERALVLAGGLGCRWAEVQVLRGGREKAEGGELVVVYAVVLGGSIEDGTERDREYALYREYIYVSRLSM